MPQLNPEFFISQLFWLVITFSFLIVFLWKISLPRINTALERRENKINDDIESSKKLQTEAEKIQLDITKQLTNSKEEVDKLIKKSLISFQKKSDEELINIDKKLENKIDESSKIILNNKNDAVNQINQQIFEITKLTLSKITSIKISDLEIKNSVSKTKLENKH